MASLKDLVKKWGKNVGKVAPIAFPLAGGIFKGTLGAAVGTGVGTGVAYGTAGGDKKGVLAKSLLMGGAVTGGVATIQALGGPNQIFKSGSDVLSSIYDQLKGGLGTISEALGGLFGGTGPSGAPPTMEQQIPNIALPDIATLIQDKLSGFFGGVKDQLEKTASDAAGSASEALSKLVDMTGGGGGGGAGAVKKEEKAASYLPWILAGGGVLVLFLVLSMRK